MTLPATDDAIIEVLDSSPTGVVISTLEEGTILYANDVMAAFFGMSRDEVVGLPTTSFFVNPADRIKVRDAIASEGEVRKLKIRNRTPHGGERSSIFSCRLIDYQGERAVLSWLEDETERERREHEMLSAAKQVELLHQIAGICNRAVNFYDALRKGSAEIAKCLGWPVSVVYRQAHGDEALLQLSSLSLPKDNPDYEFLRTSLVGQTYGAGVDVPGRALASHSIVWIGDIAGDPGVTRFNAFDPVRIASALAIPIVAENEVVAVLELLTSRLTPQDEHMTLTLAQVSAELSRVHLRDQTTVALQEARAEAESSARAKASFLAAMSHEVRTPMNGVVGMVDLVLRTKLDDEQRFMLQTVKESGNALIKVINDILDFSKIEAGRLEIEQAPFSITKAVEAVALSLAPAVQKKKLNLVTFIDPAIPDEVLGDAVRVNQILSNLGSNAVKFSTAGEIVIKAEKIGDAGEVLRVRFSVRDEGIGIAADALHRLFEEFQQADTSTTRRFGGTGLGLAICQRLITLMGGDIGVDSLLGAGSTFHCELPFGTARTDTAAFRPHKIDGDLEGLRVMVVAESAEVRAAAQAYLSYWKADVEAFARLRDCIPQLYQTGTGSKTKPVDVVVIPQITDARQIAALRQGLADAGLGPRQPRLVIARDPTILTDDANQPGIAVVTLLDTNPMRRSALITAVAVAAGRASPEMTAIEEPEPMSDVAPPTVDEALKQGRLILVAEDHPANQDVLRRQLNRLGYACEIAEDGAAALKMWRAKKYALLLTDCHMPNMDGFGLTAEVRRAEQGTDAYAPIIAITANVLQGEAERCLAAGMDAFLPKPVELATLRTTLAKWIGGKESVAPELPAPQERAAPLVLDLGRIRDAFGEIDDGVREYFDVFIDSVSPLIGQFEDELAAQRLLEARETIHKAKGATANAGGQELAALMHDIEVALVEQNYDVARHRMREIRPAWERLTHAISQT